MFKKGTKIYSIVKGKCPRCHEGDFFRYKFTFNPSKITQLHSNCPSCNLKYMMEPSFFYGAMYVNYGITVALSIIVFLISKLLFGFTLLQSFIVIIVALVVLAPVNLRLSRILWINMFVGYKKFSQKQKPQE
ncbi:DUF983 domain-containing protein [Polaribacter batillariae]|uniref:DUF983 domain-containing protein n=2 Tax=Polaribacter batillariae TaxID=2808900 RepID=A0ABX7T2W6_9FLAO|nr:DUF983 domain-containing protein [Polaribacter batillariae]